MGLIIFFFCISRSILSPMFVRKPRTIDAEEGNIVIIECEVAGDPKPSVKWLRDWLDVSTHKIYFSHLHV